MIDLLPHEGPARLLVRVVDSSPDSIVAEAAVERTAPYVIDGAVPSYVALEMAAQAAAALEAIESRRQGDGSAPRTGFLVRARRVRLEAAEFAPARPLRVTVQRIARAGPLHTYRARVSSPDGPLLDGELSTFVPEAG